MCLTAAEGGVGTPDTDGSDCPVVPASLCPATPGTGLAPDVFIQRRAGRERSGSSLPCSEWSEWSVTLRSHTAAYSLRNKSLLGMWSKQGSIGTATPPSGASALAEQRETSKVGSLASWPSGAEREPGGAKGGHDPSGPEP